MNWQVDNAGRLTEVSLHTPFSGFVAWMHTSLHLDGGIGGFIVGAAGVALLSSLISDCSPTRACSRMPSICAWAATSGCRKWTSIIVWAFGRCRFHILISLSGALLGLTVLIVGVLAWRCSKGDTEKAYALFSGPQPPADERPLSEPINFPAILADIRTRAPQASLDYMQIEHVGTMGAAINLNVLTPNHASARRDLRLWTEPASPMAPGATRRARWASASTWFWGHCTSAFSVAGPVKIAYVLLGFALTSVTSSGVAIWLARRRGKAGLPLASNAFGAASVWSQPVAYAAAGIYALLMHPADDDQIIPIWASVTLLSSCDAFCKARSVVTHPPCGLRHGSCRAGRRPHLSNPFARRPYA